MAQIETFVLLFLAAGACCVTIQVSPRSKFCFHEDVKTVQSGLENKKVAVFSFTVLKGGRHKDITAIVSSAHKNGVT